MSIPRAAPSTATANLVRVWDAVYDRWPRAVSSAGVFACRRVNFAAPPASWSYHAWGQAWDITGASSTLDRVYAYLSANRARFHIVELLWRVPNHYDHIHVAVGPDRSDQVPPCAGSEEAERVAQVIRLPTEQRAVVGESWAPAARQAARQLVRAAERINRSAGAVRSIIDGG